MVQMDWRERKNRKNRKKGFFSQILLLHEKLWIQTRKVSSLWYSIFTCFNVSIKFTGLLTNEWVSWEFYKNFCIDEYFFLSILCDSHFLIQEHFLPGKVTRRRKNFYSPLFQMNFSLLFNIAKLDWIFRGLRRLNFQSSYIFI